MDYSLTTPYSYLYTEPTEARPPSACTPRLRTPQMSYTANTMNQTAAGPGTTTTAYTSPVSTPVLPLRCGGDHHKLATPERWVWLDDDTDFVLQIEHCKENYVARRHERQLQQQQRSSLLQSH
eukprot:TRINITY_DN4481_c0_g1_i1.p1 TRINITY_DN4481_c0_g1~~TRINITY_DN4481_c0_g1_i1.p1  ORF type:complete len:123 (-),score=23.55 TRINITY_DN4481_c0_g1_i1:106-474(-)